MIAREKTRVQILLAVSVFLVLISFRGPQPWRQVLYQVSTMAALEQGDYAGRISIHNLRRMGDFGLGTFEGLDGEMIVLAGRIYQVTVDGAVHQAQDSMRSPFAVVIRFENKPPVALEESLSLSELEGKLDQMLADKDKIYAIKIEGEFSRVQARSVPRQPKPYPPLSTAIKSQQIFELQDQTGTMAGFWFPKFMSGVNAPGYHFHFLSRDRQAGGHLLDCRAQKVKIFIDRIEQFHLLLADSAAKEN